jgi:adenylate cyclase
MAAGPRARWTGTAASVTGSAIEVNPVERLPPWLQHVVDSGLDPTDDAGLRLRKRMLMLVVLFSTTVITLVLLATLGVGDARAAITAAVYVVVTGFGLVHFVLTKRVGPLLYSQLAMFLVLPAAQQWLLGGFTASASSVLYSMNAALLAVVLVGARRARWWFLAFAGVVLILGVADGWLARTVTPLDVPIQFFHVITILVVALLAWLPLAFFVEARRRLVAELDQKNAELERERHRSELLLLNILPEEIARRLKDGERPIADRFPDVAVLFADVAGFTPIAQHMDPEELISSLDQIFTRFDRLAASLGLEKVKTIGDAYMAVCGAPRPEPDAAERMANMALQMQASVADLTFGSSPLRIRIGLDVGPLVAGVIGESKFAWDRYGDVVNTAARMESHGLPGEIHMTERFHRRLPGSYRSRERGWLEIKGKGLMRTFLLDGEQTGTPVPGQGG